MTVSTSEQTLLQTWRALKPDQQKTAVEFVEFLRHKSVSKQPRRSLPSLCADPAVHISADDIAEARREMWGDFPTGDRVMTTYVADTHAVIWYLLDAPDLSAPARTAFQSASMAGDPVFVSAITLVEITYLAEKGKLPAHMPGTVAHAIDDEQSALVLVPVDRSVVDSLPSVPRTIRAA